MQYQVFPCWQPSQDTFGYVQPLPFATATVYAAGTTTPASLYDINGTSIANPAIADVNGWAAFRAADGSYDIVITSSDGTFSDNHWQSVQFLDKSSFAGVSGLAGLGTTGVVIRTGSSGGSSTYATRLLTSTAGTIGLTNPDGVSGNINIDIPNGTITNALMSSGAALANLGYTAESTANKSTDGTFASNSDTLYPSQKAAKTYADTKLAPGGNLTGSINGAPLGTDTLTQGQALAYDAVTSKLRAAGINGANLLVNSAFDIWQAGGSFTVSGGVTKTHIADFWKAAVTDASGSVKVCFQPYAAWSNQAQAKYGVQWSRVSGDTIHLGAARIAQQFGSADAQAFAGQTVTVSFDFMTGLNYSQTSGPYVSLLGGTGIDEDFDLHAGTPNFTTGGTSVTSASLASQVGAAHTITRITATLTVPAGISEFAIVISSGPYIGAAGADDSFVIGRVKMEFGNVATPYVKPLFADELVRSKRRYQKSFPYSANPIQAFGAGTGEFKWQPVLGGGGSTTNRATVQFQQTMRAVPTVSLFSPVSGNFLIRDETANADVTTSTTDNISDSSFEIVGTVTGATAGNAWGVHWVADGRL